MLKKGNKVEFKRDFGVYQKGDKAYVFEEVDGRGYVTVTPRRNGGTPTSVPIGYLKKA